MEYLTEVKRSLAELYYSDSEGVLTVGNRTLPLEPAYLQGESPWNIVPFDGPNQINSAVVCLNPHSKPIGTPQFHSWLAQIKCDEVAYQEVKTSTLSAISKVLATLEPGLEIPDIRSYGVFSFGMGVTAENHANLQTFGNCACLHQNPEGHWVDYREWDEGFCEYDWHNIDADSQAWSLLAGIGHLALLASEVA